MTLPAHRVTLASASPRRKDLLAQIGIDAIVTPSHADEESISIAALRREGVSADAAPAQLALRRARLKAQHAELRPGTMGLLAADTVVALDGHSLEKPWDAAHAQTMLTQLSGRDHQVHTAIVFVPSRGDLVEEITTTTVTFLSLSHQEIDAYVSTGEWQGVAAGYRIQGHGGAYVLKICGSYSAVVGLPLGTVYSIIKRFWT